MLRDIIIPPKRHPKASMGARQTSRQWTGKSHQHMTITIPSMAGTLVAIDHFVGDMSGDIESSDEVKRPGKSRHVREITPFWINQEAPIGIEPIQ